MRPRMAGLNERRKQRTRRLIGDTARTLFTEHGFDRITVVQIAEACEVSEKTIYNYFPTKAHLVFDDDETVLDGLVDALRQRPPGQSALQAMRKALAEMADRMGEGHPSDARAAFRRMVNASPTLLLHQQAMTVRYERALTEVLAEQAGGAAPEPFIVAVALVGALRAGFETDPVEGGVADAFSRALDLLEGGLAGYGSDHHGLPT
ncbi:TetR/AcrR family transcriptional regulator [Nonomuraea sp. NPDC050556]|uniref:TetR/AcrR family transcriptional regulator n=1 Tax=Nonomuraea sp. NPDC050556 TaxID=3364369 RepID=UPI0037B26EB0